MKEIEEMRRDVCIRVKDLILDRLEEIAQETDATELEQTSAMCFLAGIMVGDLCKRHASHKIFSIFHAGFLDAFSIASGVSVEVIKAKQ